MQHATTHGNLDQRLTAAGQPLMIAAEPTPARDPGEAPLHDPSSGLGTKPCGKQFLPLDLFALWHQQAALGHREGFDRLHLPAQMDFEPGHHRSSIVAISPDQLHPGKHLFEWQE